MRALVTGAGGFIGANLVARLTADGHRVAALVRPTSDLSRLNQPGLELVLGDLSQPSGEPLAKALAQAEVVFHLAGVTRAANQQGYLDGNLGITRNLLSAMDAHSPSDQRLVYLSSQTAAGPCAQPPGSKESDPPQPVSAYGRAKLAAEQAVLAAGAHRWVCVVRPPAVYGPGDVDWLDVFRWIKRGVIALSGFRPMPMSLIHCDDLIEAMLLAVGHDQAAGQVYFATDGVEHTFESIAQAAAAAMGRSPLTLKFPMPLIRLLCGINGFMSRMGARPVYLNPDKWLEAKQDGWLCDSSRARMELGFAPLITLQQGMAATAKWYQDAGLL